MKQLEMKKPSTSSSTTVGYSFTTKKGVLCMEKWRKRYKGERRRNEGVY
jgi:hypothetical protein